MIQTYLIGIAGIVLIMVSWVGIQRIWHRVFHEYVEDEDALAERNTCGNCGCTTLCERNKKQVIK